LDKIGMMASLTVASQSADNRFLAAACDVISMEIVFL
jgi:hypothetical protein